MRRLKKIMLTLKIIAKGYLIVYISNILVYFLYVRNRMLDGIEVLMENDESYRILKAHNITRDYMLDGIEHSDSSMFHPLYNLAYSIGNYYIIITSLVVLTILILIKIKNQKKYALFSANVQDKD